MATDTTLLDLIRDILGAEYVSSSHKDACAILVATSTPADVFLDDYLKGHLEEDWRSKYPVTPQNVATALYTLFVQEDAPEGVEGKWFFKDGVPDDFRQTFWSCWNGDAWRGTFLNDAAVLLSEVEDWGREIEDLPMLEGDSRTWDLLQWLASDTDRLNFVDDWRSEVGASDLTINDISGGQSREKEEVLGLLIEAINEFVEEYAPDEDDDEDDEDEEEDEDDDL